MKPLSRMAGIHRDRFCGCGWSLSPTTFNEHPAAIAVHVPMGDPVRVRPGWQFPTAGYPNVASAIPAVISPDPDIAGAGPHYSGFDDRTWRGHPNNHLCRHRAATGQHSGKDQPYKLLTRYKIRKHTPFSHLRIEID